jgi:site-specific DNA-methyltransferase (adenine-specific)
MRILKSLEKKWNYREEIIWVKADRDASRSVSGMEQIESISLDTIPFSHICVLEKRSSRFEYLDRTERLSSLKISASKKMEMEDSIWYAVPKSGEKYKDRLAKEVAVRLIMLYSKKGEIVLDPFADCGLIEVTAKVLGRRYIAFASDLKSYSNIKRRLE